MTINQQINTLTKLLKEHQHLIDTKIQQQQLANVLHSLENNTSLAQNEDRALRIAVVGQMKAGKSSFINALLFPIDILPKAAVPMTAALTRIAYAEQLAVEITFYSEADWRIIEEKEAQYHKQYEEIKQSLTQPVKTPTFAFKKSKKSKATPPSDMAIQSQISDELRSCQELVHSAKHIDLTEKLGSVVRLEAGSIHELSRSLHDYVGSSGRYTAITKMLTLYVNDERLKGIELYDTPGFNDPIVSRGHQTRQFLSQSDVVFLLSSVNQFLTKSDMSLLREQLSISGIDSKAIHIVASQSDLMFRMDMKLMAKATTLAQKYPEVHRAKARVAAAMQLIDKTVYEMAFKTLSEQLKQEDLDSNTKKILIALSKEKAKPISSISWRTAEQLDNLTGVLKEEFEKFCLAAGYQPSKDELIELSQINRLQDILVAQKTHKESLIKQKYQLLQDSLADRLQHIRAAIITKIEANLQSIDELNLSELIEKSKKQQLLLESCSQQFSETITTHKQQVSSSMNDLDKQIATKINDFSGLQTKEHREVKVDKIKKSGFFAGLARFFDVGGYEHKTTEIVSEYAQVHDAIDNIEKFKTEVDAFINDYLQDSVSTNTLNVKLSRVALEAFDLSDPSFNVDNFKLQMTDVIGQFNKPKVTIDIEEKIDNITHKFGYARVQEEKIKQLIALQTSTIKEVFGLFQTELREKIRHFEDYFDEINQRFVTNLINVRYQNLQAQSKLFEDKAHSIEQLKAFREKV